VSLTLTVIPPIQFKEHADEHTTVWNLAAPLSVETAMDPAVAEAVTVGGMSKVLDAMKQVER